MKSFTEKVGTYAIVVPLVACVIAWKTWVFTVLWGWFIVPFGLPPITLGWGIGIGLTFGAMRYSTPVKRDDDTGIALRNFAFWTFGPAVALGIGFLLQPVGVA